MPKKSPVCLPLRWLPHFPPPPAIATPGGLPSVVLSPAPSPVPPSPALPARRHRPWSVPHPRWSSFPATARPRARAHGWSTMARPASPTRAITTARPRRSWSARRSPCAPRLWSSPRPPRARRPASISASDSVGETSPRRHPPTPPAPARSVDFLPRHHPHVAGDSLMDPRVQPDFRWRRGAPRRKPAPWTA